MWQNATLASCLADVQIIVGIRKGESIITIKGFAGDVKIQKIANNNNRIAFLCEVHGGFIDPSNIICNNIIEKIKKANNQLGNMPDVNKRILLLINAYDFGEIESYNKAFDSLQNILKDLNNIDEIWLQIKNDDLHHISLYRR